MVARAAHHAYWVNAHDTMVAYLYGNATNRNLNLNYVTDDWNDDYRFHDLCEYLCYSPSNNEGECCVMLLFHPPSIFPIIESDFPNAIKC